MSPEQYAEFLRHQTRAKAIRASQETTPARTVDSGPHANELQPMSPMVRAIRAAYADRAFADKMRNADGTAVPGWNGALRP